MSLMNVYVQPDAAHIVVDTDTMVEGKPGLRISGSKFDLFPVARSVLVHVGRGDVAWHVVRSVCARSPQSFEDIEQVLPADLQALFDQFAAEARGAIELDSTFVLVGYSRMTQRFKCTAFDCKEGASRRIAVATIPAPEGCLTPDIPGLPFVFEGLDSMLAHARRQVEHARTAFPGMACGGNLMSVSCRPTSFHVEDHGPV